MALSSRSGRRRGHPRHPPTPPYVRFPIRRFSPRHTASIRFLFVRPAFASGLLQICSHPRHPCLWLTLPLARCVEDFHLQAARLTTTVSANPTAPVTALRAMSGARNKKPGTRPGFLYNQQLTRQLLPNRRPDGRPVQRKPSERCRQRGNRT